MKEEGNVQISIYNVKGEKVATIFDEFVPSETLQKIIWNGTSHNGKTVASGLYFYRLESSEHQEIKKMLLIK
jgi:flagellar hook assembly protein FlgD